METKDLRVIEQSDIDKKQTDCRAYKGLVLLNQMKVMLISDLNLSKNYVALDVHIGSCSNPDDFPGMAHLCQQMIVLGSQKYPVYKQFEKFILSHDGDMYLITSSDHTTYYFDMDKKNDLAFEEALDRFVQFFLTPLVKDSWITEEIRMINAKLEIELQHHDTWFQYFERSMVKSTHPYSKYALCKEDILHKVSAEIISLKILDFFKKYYSANIMTLCVASGYLLNKIEKMIVKTFCQIRNKDIKILESYEDPFKDQLCTRWDVVAKNVTAKNFHILRLLFPLPNLKEDCWHQAVNLISHFLESQDESALIENLRTKSWCSSISTGGYQEARGLNFFQVHITLLPEGLLNIVPIMKLFFQYIYVFKLHYLEIDDDKSELKEVLHNMSRSGMFEDQETITQERIIKIVKRLHEYSIKSILFNEYSERFEYTVSMIEDIFNNYISPQTIRLYVIANRFNYIVEKISPGWDNAKYTDLKISDQIIDEWINISGVIKLILPKLEFQPGLINFNKSQLCKQIPEIIKDSPYVRLWYMYEKVPKLDKGQPQSKMFFHFISPCVNDFALNGILNVIFAKLLNNVIKEDEYFSKNALQWQLKSTRYGILVEVTNYITVQYREFLSKIISNILNLKIRPRKFETFKHHLMKNLKSFGTLRPMEQAYYYLLCVLSEKFPTYNDVLDATIYVTFDKTQKFIEKFVRKMYIECLIYGDVSKEQALNIIRNLEFDVEASRTVEICQPTELAAFREISLLNDTHMLLEVNNEFHDVSCVQAYYQVGETAPYINSMLDLLCYILSKRCSAYFKIFKRLVSRTCIKRRNTGGAQGFIIAVEGFMKPRVFQHHIEQLIFYMMDYICRMDEKQFKRYKNKLITIRYSKVLKFNEIADAFWEEIFSDVYVFNRAEIERRYIEDIKKEQLYQFYLQNVYNKQAVLFVHVLPKRKDKLEEESSSKSEEFSSEQSESSDDKFIEPNMFEIRVEIHKSSVFTNVPSTVMPRRIVTDETDFVPVLSILRKYFTMLENFRLIKILTPNETQQCTEKIDNIELFKQDQYFYKRPPISKFRNRGEFPNREYFKWKIRKSF